MVENKKNCILTHCKKSGSLEIKPDFLNRVQRTIYIPIVNTVYLTKTKHLCLKPDLTITNK